MSLSENHPILRGGDGGNHATPMLNSDGCDSDYSVIDRYADRFNLNLDKDWSYREKKLFILKKFLEGSIYDNLSPFHIEFTGNSSSGKYIKLSQRRPSVIYNMNKIIVDESVTMLFGLDHFPTIRCGEGHEETEQFLQSVTRKSKLRRVMLEAAKIGSIGSVCILVKILSRKFNFQVLNTKNITPFFDKLDPEVLEKIIEKKKLDGNTLISCGYKIKADEGNKFFYIIREINKTNEIFYKPYLCEKEKEEGFKPIEDKEKSEEHNFGFVPAIWIKNLPSSQNIDGACTFECILDIGIEIDYQESQTGRLFKYNSDPTLVIKNPQDFDGDKIMKSLSVLTLDEKGDAYYAEMSGKSSDAVMNYVEKLRQYALEVARGNRTNPDKVTMAQSGKAIQMLNSSLIGLVNEMRITYGDDGLIPLYQMILKISQNKQYEIDSGDGAPKAGCEDHLILDWPDWYPKSAQEELQEEQTLVGYVEAGIISQESALKTVAGEYNILDTKNEIKLIDNEKNKDYNQELKSNQSSSAGATSKK